MFRSRHVLSHLLLLLVVLVPGSARAGDLEVSAAASLSEPFREIGQLFALRHDQKVSFNFGASNELRLQIENGAPADVYAAASAEELDKALASRAVVPPATVFAHNRLIVIVPRDNPGQVARLADLARGGLKFVTSHPNVPVGKYTLLMLERMGRDPAYGPAYRDAVMRNVVSLETSVKQVVAKVALGEADAGVVYESDVVGRNADRLRSFDVPDAYNVQAAYSLAVTAGSKRPDAARRFLALVLSPEGQAILHAYRFQGVVRQ